MAFPSAYLDAVALNAALAAMAGQGRFARLLFYLEACESGSMFEELLAVQRRQYAAGGDFLTLADFELILPEGDCGGEVRRRVRARSVCV